MNSCFHNYLSSACSVLCSSYTALINTSFFKNYVSQNVDSTNGWVNRKKSQKGIHSRENDGNLLSLPYPACHRGGRLRPREGKGLAQDTKLVMARVRSDAQISCSIALCFFSLPKAVARVLAL